jgi:vacuolar-type H+-ATPase subunit E/Vma4
MALPELLRNLEHEADAQVRALLAEARAAADQLRAERAADLARRHAAASDTRAVELRAAAAQDVEAARRNAARLVLEARAELLERIRRQAEARLAAASGDPGSLPTLRRDLALALEYAGPVAVTVEVPAPLLIALGEAIADRSHVTLVPAGDGRHGLTLRTADGTLVVDASSGHRLARAWPRLAIELARRLDAAP